jgi:hypothetical protein
MIELLNKIIDTLKGLFPYVVGYLMAKNDSKIDDLKSENEKLKEWKEIDEKIIKDSDIYDSNTWR